MNKSTDVLCLVGARGSGKSTAARFFERQGFIVVSAAKKNRQLALDAGWRLDTPSLQDFGLKIVTERTEPYFASELAKGVLDQSRIVFDGIRAPGVIEALASWFLGLRVVLIEAPETQRRERLLGRGDDPVLDSHPIEALVTEIAQRATVSIRNDGTQKDFERRLRQLVR